MSFTRTHTVRTPANPYLVCSECGAKVEGWPVYPDAGFGDAPPTRNLPCEHEADYDNLCPSWSPVGGCRCVEFLGKVEHPVVVACS